MGWHCTKAIPRSIFIYFDVKSIWIKFGMEAAYIKVLGMATKAISRSKHVFIFKTGFRMSFHFQNVVIFRNVFSLSKCERSTEIVQKLRFDIVLKIHVTPHLRKLTKSFTNSLWHMVICHKEFEMTVCHREFVNDRVPPEI